MGFALTNDSYVKDWSASLTSDAKGLGTKLKTPLRLHSLARKGASLTAVCAISAVTVSSYLEAKVAKVSTFVSETDMQQNQSVVALHPQLIEPYAEINSYFDFQNGWDGLGSIAPKRDDIGSALNFLAALPVEVSAPEPGVTADGYVELYWRSERGVVTVSFNSSRMIYYARNAIGKLSDMRKFDGRGIPSELVDAILVI